MGKKQNGGPMLFVKNGGKLSAPSDRPGGPLISYYAKKGGKIPQANFTNYSGTQMYGTGGNFDYNLPSMKYSQTPSGQAYKNGGTIHINPANKGKFNATKARTGKSTEELTHSSNPVTKKRAVFAQNAAKWKHANGGPLLVGNQHVAMGGSLKMYDEGGALNVAYRNGGKVNSPLPTTDPRKVQRYTDSLNLYNKGIEDEKFHRTHGMANNKTHEFPFSRVTSYGYATKPKDKIQPTSAVSQVTDPAHPSYYRAEWLKYKQPVQPYYLQKEQPPTPQIAPQVKATTTKDTIMTVLDPGQEWYLNETQGYKKKSNGGKINPYALNIVGKGLKKYLLGGPTDETDGVISGNQTPFSLWSRNQNMPAQTQQEGVFNIASNQQRKNFVTSEFAPGTEGKGMSIPETPEPQDTFKNEKLAASLYSGSIQAGSSFMANQMEKNRRAQEGAHDTGTMSEYAGAAKGMGKGASIGSALGPIGTFAGAAVGGVAGYFSGKAEGKVKKRAYDAWQADYMRAEQSRIDSNSSRYQDFKPTGSGYYAKGGKMYRPGGQLPTKYVTDPNDKRLRNYQDSLKLYNSYEDLKKKLIDSKYQNLGTAGSFGKLTDKEVIEEATRDKSDDSILTDYFGKFVDKRPYIKASKEGSLYKTLDFYPGKINEELGYQYFSTTIKPKSEEEWRRHRVYGDSRLVKNYSNVNPIQPVELSMKASPSNPPPKGVPGYKRMINGLPDPKKTSPSMQSLHPQYMQSSPVSMQGQPMQIQPMTLPQQKGKPVYGPGNTIIGYNGEDGKMRKAYQYTGAPNNELNLQDKALLADKDKWQQYLSSKDSGYKFATGGSMASNYMANQKAVGGNLVPLSSDAVEVKGPSHANGGVKLPEMEAEVEGKEVIKDDYVFSEQLGFAKEAKKLAKAKGRIEEKPSTPERINSLKLLESKENQLKLAQEFIRKQNNLQ